MPVFDRVVVIEQTLQFMEKTSSCDQKLFLFDSGHANTAKTRAPRRWYDRLPGGFIP
jgi:hypothetical protein